MNAIGFAFRIVFATHLLGAALILSGCQAPTADTSSAQVDLTMEPSEPVVGSSLVSIRLADADGELIEGASVRVEGNMNHAGMKPSFADLTENEPGQYSGTLEFTMGGDWFLLVTATTPENGTIERQIDVPGVRAK